jgi:membrane protein
VLSAGIAAAAKFLRGYIPANGGVWEAANLVASVLVITILFALIFRILPDTYIAWRDVWVGAALTSVLFTAGKFLIGLYLGKAAVASSYGAAGSLIIVLLWTYYSSQILFFGAEFTRVFAHRFGTRQGTAASERIKQDPDSPAGIPA